MLIFQSGPILSCDHVTSTDHNLKWDLFEILAKGRSDTHCKIKETLLIQELKPALISIDFDDFTSPFTPWFLFRLRIYIKHSRLCFLVYRNTSNFVKNTPLRAVFSTLFSVFEYPDETLSLVFDMSFTDTSTDVTSYDTDNNKTSVFKRNFHKISQIHYQD